MNALLALFIRSLREGVRARTTYVARAGLVFFVLVELAGIHLKRGWTGAPGLELFNVVISTDLLFITLVGMSYFASAIAEEKEEMTLGLLRMTDLNSLSILLGKSTSRICGVLLLLAAQFPFTLLAVAFGGVNADQVLAAYTCLGAFIFFLANLALVFSVMAKRTAGAAIYTALVLLGLLITPGLVKGVVWVLGRLGWLAATTPGPLLAEFLNGWNEASPFMRLNEISTTGFHGGPICWQVVSNLLLGGGFFALAWAAFQYFADQPGEVAPPRTMAARKSSPLAVLGAGRPWRWAMLWKDFYFIAGGKVFFALRILGCVAVGLWCFEPWARVRPQWSTIGYYSAPLFGLLLMLDLAFAASRIFRLEHKAQTLSTLAMLPMSMRRVAWQKAASALLVSLPVLLCFLFGATIAVPNVIADLQQNFAKISGSAGTPGAASTMSTIYRSVIWVVAGETAVLVAGAILIVHLAAWLSLRLKWGAFPLALATWLVGTQIATLLFAFFFQQAGPFIFAAVELFFAVFLHFGVGQRLEVLAAED